MIDLLSKVSITIGNPCLALFVAAVLFIFSKKLELRKRQALIYMLLFTMIYNDFLKQIFRQPLPETCPSSGFGFPSGHMSFFSVFFFWIFLEYKNNLVKILSILLLVFIGWGIVYNGFHYTIDVICAPLFSASTIYIYRKFVEPQNTLRTFCIINSTSIMIMLAIYCMINSVTKHVLQAYFIITAFGISNIIFQKDKKIKHDRFLF